MKVSSLSILLVAALLHFSPAAEGDAFPPGSYTQISLPFNGQVFGLNDSDEFVGSYTDSSGNVQGFLDNKGVFTTIDFPGSSYTEAYAINNSGEIAGFSKLPNALFGFVFLYANGAFTSIVTNPQPDLSGIAINNSGAVVGTYASCITDYCGAGFEYLNGQFGTAQLSSPPSGPDTTTLSGINDQGESVGGYGFDPFGHTSYPMSCIVGPVVVTNFINLICNPLSSVLGVPTGINDLGEIIGNNFLYENGVVYQLPNAPTGINNLGQIVLGGDSLFTPSSVPEPATYVLLGFGLTGLLIVFGRRRSKVVGQKANTTAVLSGLR